MSIRLKIALWFTFLVSSLLFISFLTINEWLYGKNKAQFEQRLKNRTITTARLWHSTDTQMQNVMFNLDSGSVASLKNKYIAIYNDSTKVQYQFADNPLDLPVLPASFFKKANEKGELSFSLGKRDGYLLRTTVNNRKLYIGTIAYNEYRETVGDNLKTILWVIAIIGFFVSFLSGWFFSGVILRPINRIVKEVNQFSSTNISNRISAGDTKDELNALAETFNGLLNRLEESFLIQRKFISNASHELSTPLTSISSQLDVGLQQKRNVEEYETILKSVSDEVHVMQDLTKSLLEIARTGNEGAIELTDVRVDEVLMKVASFIKKMFPDYSINIRFADFPEDENECIVHGNPDLLYTAFKNIVENGCKYSDDKKIIVNLNFFDKKILLDFINSGDVIVEEEIEKIFQPFFRGSGALEKPGFGLGLPLTKRIIHLHNGILKASSDPLQGTRFHIEFTSKAAS